MRVVLVLAMIVGFAGAGHQYYRSDIRSVLPNNLVIQPIHYPGHAAETPNTSTGHVARTVSYAISDSDYEYLKRHNIHGWDSPYNSWFDMRHRHQNAASK